MKINLAITTSLLITLVYSGQAQAARNNVTCGITQGSPLTNAYGPFDFTNPGHKKRIPIVLGAHFTPQIERLTKGARVNIMGNIDYTLRAIPNYHRALYSVAKHQRQVGKLADKYYSAECYFRRAIYFQPRDDTSRMLFGMHLHLTGKYKQAKTLYQQALAIRPDGAELNYNYGLLLVDMTQYKLAKQAAKVAYDKGYPLQGLKNKLAGH